MSSKVLTKRSMVGRKISDNAWTKYDLVTRFLQHLLDLKLVSEGISREAFASAYNRFAVENIRQGPVDP